MRGLMVAVALVAGTGSASAQSIVDAYYAELSTQDMFNSSGVRLGSLGAILQQDRANVHRFGRRDAGDEIDPYFGNPDLRAQIPGLYTLGDTDPLIERIVLGGSPLNVLVLLCGPRSVPQYIVVDFADGDGNRGC